MDNCLLDDAVYHRRHSQLALPFVGGRNALSPHILRPVATIEQFSSQFSRMCSEPFGYVIDGHSIDSRSPSIALHFPVCPAEGAGGGYGRQQAFGPVQFLLPRRKHLLLQRWRSCGNRTLTASKWARPFCQRCEIKLGLICYALSMPLYVHGYPAELSGLDSVLPRWRAGTMTSADSRCTFLAHRCASSRLLRQCIGSLRIRHVAFTQCKPNLPCALLTEYRA